jgi:hypothetical protein
MRNSRSKSSAGESGGRWFHRKLTSTTFLWHGTGLSAFFLESAGELGESSLAQQSPNRGCVQGCSLSAQLVFDVVDGPVSFAQTNDPFPQASHLPWSSTPRAGLALREEPFHAGITRKVSGQGIEGR